ncbi:MAG: SDR family oxidoreductase [Sphingomonadales bacterium]|nr:SDR family oxidoreductase [Sphingomonadales bacterium]
MRILITGSNGLLGQKITDLCLQKQLEFLATSSGENRYSTCPQEHYQTLDITDEQNFHEVLGAYQPTHVIHTAAMTNVDQCELQPEACDLVNRQAVQLLANYCQVHQIHLQLLSTDFVFDGEAGPYTETDQPNPLSVYARSKVEAEKIVQNAHGLNYSIVRTIIVYGSGENLSRSNLILWAKEALTKGDPLQIVDDQFRAPTWAADLAWACVRICELSAQGIFHIAGPEILSIYEIVGRVAAYYGLSMDNVSRLSSATLKQPAKRPPRTGFVLDKARKALGFRPHTLEQTFELL